MYPEKQKEELQDSNSKDIENVLSATESEGTPFLQIEELHNPILSQESISPRPNAQPNGLVAEIELASNGFRERSVSIGQQEHLVVNLEVVLPSLHHESIVHRNTCNGIHPLRLQLPRLLHESRHVLLRARGSERARHREQHRLLSLRQLRHRRRLDLAVGVQEGEGSLRKLVADADGSGDGGRGGGGESEGFGMARSRKANREFGREGFGREERDGGGREEPGECS